MAWRYIAARLNGNGTETFLDYDLPLAGAEIHRELSGPGGLSGTISPEVAALKGPDGEPILQPWSTVIYAEESGVIRDGAILESLTENGPDLDLDAVGFTGYAKDEPYTSVYTVYETDALAVARHVWAHIQSKRGGNLGIEVDDTRSGVLLGIPEDPKLTAAKSAEGSALAAYDAKRKAYNANKSAANKKAMEDAKKALDKAKDTTSKIKDGEAKPYVLNWWETFDLGGELDALAADTPFDYRMEHSWSGDEVKHFLRLGYPLLGRRRHDLRFMVGENVYTVPQVERNGEDYADTVVVLGAGEGRKMVRATASNVSGRLHRTKIHEDKSLRTTARAQRVASALLKAYSGEPQVTELEVVDHPNARLGSYDVGDEILVQHPDGWSDVAVWSRIISISFHPESGSASLELLPA